MSSKLGGRDGLFRKALKSLPVQLREALVEAELDDPVVLRSFPRASLSRLGVHEGGRRSAAYVQVWQTDAVTSMGTAGTTTLGITTIGISSMVGGAATVGTIGGATSGGVSIGGATMGTDAIDGAPTIGGATFGYSCDWWSKCERPFPRCGKEGASKTREVGTCSCFFSRLCQFLYG